MPCVVQFDADWDGVLGEQQSVAYVYIRTPYFKITKRDYVELNGMRWEVGNVVSVRHGITKLFLKSNFRYA